MHSIFQSFFERETTSETSCMLSQKKEPFKWEETLKQQKFAPLWNPNLKKIFLGGGGRGSQFVQEIQI